MSNNSLVCYNSELKQVREMTFEEMFSGFDSIKMIVFSYELKFLENIIQYFDDAKILIGGNFIYEKDKKFQSVLLAIADKAKADVQKELEDGSYLGRGLLDGFVEVKTTGDSIDHSKLYILYNSETGKKRVIIPSANGSKRAWSGNQGEIYIYDESDFGYEEYLERFNAAWENAIDIPLKVTAKKETLLDNPIIRAAKEVDKVIILQPAEQDWEYIKYAMDVSKLSEEYEELLKGTSNRKGVIELNPKNIERCVSNFKKMNTFNIKAVEKNYPSITFEFDKEKMYISGEEVDLNLSEKEIENSVEAFFELFDLYKQFINKESLEYTHWKLINLMFVSPFFSEIRIAAAVKHKMICTELPLYVMANGDSNCGKSFVIESVLNMMTGCSLEGITEGGVDSIKEAQLRIQGTPYFRDEYGSNLSFLKSHIKGKPFCELKGVKQPMIILASNEATVPKPDILKRMIFLQFVGRPPSTLTQSDLAALGGKYKKKITSTLYKEYIRRMLPIVGEIINNILTTDEDEPVKLIDISSKVLYDILDEYKTVDMPDYIFPLTWDEDFSVIRTVSDKSLSELIAEYKQNPKAFVIEKDRVLIYGDKKILESWKEGLPAETKPAIHMTRQEGCFLSLAKKELENVTKIKFRKRFSFLPS